MDSAHPVFIHMMKKRVKYAVYMIVNVTIGFSDLENG